MKLVAFFGRTNSGKTSLIERVIKRLKADGYKVLAVKHVKIKGFSMDTPGKDTWRFSEAGADRVVCVSDVEFTTIERIRDLDADSLLSRLDEGFDVVLLEGFHWLLGDREEVHKVVVANDVSSLDPFINASKNVIAITGRVAESLGESYKGIRVFKLDEEFEVLLDLIKP